MNISVHSPSVTRERNVHANVGPDAEQRELDKTRTNYETGMSRDGDIATKC